MLDNSFYIETYGCTSNKADSYIISNVLNDSGYTQVGQEDAQFLIINTCAVKEQTENKIKERLRNLHELYSENDNRYIIIAGCLPHISPKYIDVIKKIIPSFSAIIDLDNLQELPEILSEIKRGNRNLVFRSKELIDKSKILINHPKGKITGIIPISEGCLGSCTYCCVKNARGKLNCYDPNNIIRNIEHQLKRGIKQIYLTSQDCSIYQYNETQLSDLVRDIVDLDFNFFLRIGMINPSFLINKTDQLISIFKCSKVYQFLHIPIQSGSNRILKQMKRSYIISELVENIEILRNTFPSLTISTDIICGFPGETEYDFLRTVNFIKWLKPEIINISKFTPRPGTKAKQMKQLDNQVIKGRSQRLSTIFRNILGHINDNWLNWEGDVLLLHEGSEPNQAFGRNFAYKNIFVNGYNGKFGEFVKVRIEKIEGFNLYGKITN
ncbi:MAG: tRNA (N(6)-L-threonylcarbamoyladenosine(37)-C(2))-methylthiotransferase [Candidatus Thorarchaeota archaeon]